jgi:hypothetical protein
MVLGRGAPSDTRRVLRLLRRATLVVVRSIGLVLLGLPSIRHGNRGAGGAVMSNAQRHSSMQVAEDLALFGATPAFTSARRLSGHTHAHA